MLNSHIHARNLSYHYVEKYIFNGRDPSMNKYLKGITVSFLGNVNSQIPMDQIIETTINRLSKNIGGLSGITENKGPSERWVIINPFITDLREQLNVKLNRIKKSLQY